MDLKKDLTIKELYSEMRFLYSRLIRLAEKYNRSLISVSAITYKDIVTSGGWKGDHMLNDVIKREKIQDEFDIVKASYDSYKEEAVEKTREMLKTQPTEVCMVYFRDELGWKWADLSKLFNYSERQCKRIYDKWKKV